MDLSIKVTLDQSNICHFSGRSCTLQIKMHISQCIDPNPQNLVEMWFTKSYSSCKNLSLIWLHMNCHQSNLPPLIQAENCCTITDKIYSKTIASLIQFSWNFYIISYHESRECTPFFMPIQIYLITQTWLRS